MNRIVVVDDEAQVARALKTSLDARGYEVVTAATGSEAIEVAAVADPDLLIVDLGLPDMGGVEVVKRIRAFSSVPILVLTVTDDQSSKIAALDAGADDYVTKPFDMEELAARIRAALRRVGHQESAPVLTFGKLEVDLSRQLVRKNGSVIHLTRTEYALLEALVTNEGRLLTHPWLLRKVWGPGYSSESHYLRVYMGQLRKKLEDDPSRPQLIITEPGVGYRWNPESPGR